MKEDRKSLLIENAMIEFGEKGFENASLNTILKNSNMSKGVFYYYFQNKEELYFYLVEEALKVRDEIFNSIISFDEIYNKDIFEVLEIITQKSVRILYDKYPLHSKFVTSFLKEKNNKITEMTAAKNLTSKFDQIIGKLLMDAVGNGIISNEYQPQFSFRMFGFLTQFFVDIMLESKSEEEMTGNYRQFINFMKFGFTGNKK